MTRGARAVIDIAALRHNLSRVRAAAPNSRVLAVIKADAYGHGLLRVAAALAGAVDGFGVARIDEALVLRRAGITRPVLLLEGIHAPEQLAEVRAHDLEIVVHHPVQLDWLEAAPRGEPVSVWLKIDTGMHRLGFAPGQAAPAYARLCACPAVVAPPRLMSHLACADERDDPRNAAQLALFAESVRDLAGERSLAQSAGLLGWPMAQGDWVRPGIMLYGVSPFTGTVAAEFDLRPVMTLGSTLIAINRFRKGNAIGYGASWVCPEDMPVGVAAIGYGDGYPRHAPAGTPVLVNGRRAALVGRVSMDMICIDLREQPEAGVGDPVVVWGETSEGMRLPVETIAEQAGTIGYELLCGVTSRVAFSTRGE